MTGAVESITQEMPKVQAHVVDAAQDEPSTSKVNPVDDHGNAFDPSVHATGADGKGVLLKSGHWRKKRGAAKSAGRNGVVMPGMAPGDISTKVGGQMADSVFMMGILIGGDEWAPIVDEKTGVNERLQMREAFIAYCHENNVQEFPPGVALAMAMAAYVMPRFAMPKTRTRFSRFKDWAAEKYLAWKRKRTGEPAPTKEEKPKK